ENDTKAFYSREMNTRLQVEHTVTEMVTGVDIVKEMLRIASGEKLRYRQIDIQLKGHAIECRIVAEDPRTNFMPGVGQIVGLSLPTGPGVRVDTGIYYGSQITTFYDSLIAKLIVWDETRDEAIIRTRRALEEFQISGVTTAIPFFFQMMNNPDFQSGRIHTKYLEEEFMLKEVRTPELMRIAALAASMLAHQRTRQAVILTPEAGATPWRLYGRRETLDRRL
ncbi:MAG TPA: acetyl-CoA carboxylase biotin carboxylase subunit, partial [Anaerolineae bacterium]|nr:acetyl-CoA carboxylase biotin carboxylase subunit [Anaerolineae bacterium]